MIAVVLCIFLLAQHGGTAESLARDLSAARLAYDTAAAQSVREKARALVTSGDNAASRIHVEAALLVAELHRIAWEQLPESDVAHRRPFGEQIDAAAEEALASLEKLPEDSERYRLRADILGTMIRSDFRAKKYRKDMETSAAKAVELDPTNAKAYVSRAKPFVFAETNVGGDPAKAIELLTKALDLDPELEPARCLRALAYQKAGNDDLSRADWEKALADNPVCKPAADELKKLGAR
ncbi:MAG: hypothetical protein SGI88_09540 [Candidatus Hydrogenedentes bacterium]|nr:hypothetical protein [Candidatus Hydrogenedentota bacterium]